MPMRPFRPLIVAAACAALVTTSLQAQSPTIGFKLGPSFSTLSSDEDEGQKTLTKFTGGGFIRFDMGRLGLQPELMYVTKGAKASEIEQGVTFDMEMQLDYIEIPVLFVLPFGTGAGIAPHVYAGPAFAFEVGCSLSASGGGFNVSLECDDADAEFDGDRRKFDVGAMVGGGISVPMGPGAVLLEGRYNFGLMNLMKDSNETVRNRSGAVLVGYSIPIGRSF
jgi:hypothetical protein